MGAELYLAMFVIPKDFNIPDSTSIEEKVRSWLSTTDTERLGQVLEEINPAVYDDEAAVEITGVIMKAAEVLDDARYAQSWPLGTSDAWWLLVAGGESWGDDPGESWRAFADLDQLISGTDIPALEWLGWKTTDDLEVLT